MILGAGAMSINKLSRLLGVSSRTVQRSMKQYGIKKKPFLPMSNSDLDAVLAALKEQRPSMGQRYVLGFFKKNNVRIQRKRILSSMA